LATRFAVDHCGVGLVTERGHRKDVSIPRSAAPLGAEPQVGEGLRERHLKPRGFLARSRRYDQPFGKRFLLGLKGAQHSRWVGERRDILLSRTGHLLHWRGKLSLSPPPLRRFGEMGEVE
jgi:hypothetical protein